MLKGGGKRFVLRSKIWGMRGFVLGGGIFGRKCIYVRMKDWWEKDLS